MKFLNTRRNRFFLSGKSDQFWPFLILLLIAAAIPARAQQLTARPDRGSGGNGGYQSSNIDSISLQSGSVNVQIPLASLPPIAGGKLSYTLTAFYNSKLWDSHRKEQIGLAEPGCQPRYSTQEILQANNAGWRIGGQYQIFFRDAKEDYDYLAPDLESCYGTEWYHMQGRFFKPMLRMPDGSEHELRIQGYFEQYSSLGDRDHLKGFYKQPGGVQGSPAFSGPTRMYTIDGTFITAVVNPSNYAISSAIFLKDGTRIETSAEGQRTIDTNGNSILLGSRFINNGQTLENFAKDEQTGREIKWSPTAYNNASATKVEYQTVGGGWQSVYAVWGTTTVRGKVHSKVDWNQGAPCVLHEQMEDVPLQVIREIVLPATEQGVAPQKFTFGYNSDATVQATTNAPRWSCNPETFPSFVRTASAGWGELSDVTTPTGAQIEYNYSNDGLHDFIFATQPEQVDDAVNEIIKNVVTTKTVSHDGTTDTWNYSINRFSRFIIGSNVVNPDGSYQAESYYPSDIAFAGSYGTSPQGQIIGLGGLPFRSNSSGKVLNEKKWLLLGGAVTAIGAPTQGVGINPVVDTEFTTLLDDNGNRQKMTAKKFQYDMNGDVTQVIEYDWFDPSLVSYTNNDPVSGTPIDVPSGATVLRVTNNSYYNQAANAASPTAYQNRVLGAGQTVILGAIQESRVGDGATDKRSTKFSYDGLTHGSVPTKGNLTKVSTGDGSINSLTGYDSYGNVTSKTDPKGKVTQIFYEDDTHALPTKIAVDPQNGTGQQVSTRTYDFYTGLPLTSTDVNGNISSIDYTNHLLGVADPFGRSGTTFSPYVEVNGANKRLSSKTYYEDNARKTRVESDLFNEGDALLNARETRDQIGRTVLTEKNENGSGVFSISTQTVYKTAERVVLTSNPARSDTATTDGWTRVTSDILGRSIEAATFSGAAQPPVTGGYDLPGFTGKALSNYSAERITVTDQAGKKRRSVINALGQLLRVDEPDVSGQLDANGVPAQPTYYQYDALGNLTQVQQTGTTPQQCGDSAPPCTQTRTFVYDSLSRLTQATNPESGTVSYTYDQNGNLKTKRDARDIKIIYDYDALNRVQKRCYKQLPANSPLGLATCESNNEMPEPNTPTVEYLYDNLPNAKGKVTRITTAGSGNSPFSVTDFQAFDKLGRVTRSQQTIDGMVFNPQTYAYNLSGALIEQTYPSGRVVKNVIDADGDLAEVQSRDANGAFRNYADSFTYTAAGAVSSMRLGNGRWENTVFNSRLQPTQIGLGYSTGNQSLLKLGFDYGTTDNNGNVKSQTITVPTIGTSTTFTAIQSYTYDPLNRIKQATETINSAEQWKQTFKYDRFGNRNFEVANTTTLECETAAKPIPCDELRKMTNPKIDPSTNRLSTADGYLFDTAGNTTRNSQNLRFTYNGENKQSKVETLDVNGNPTATVGKYFYDGDGKRVKKVVPGTGETTIFIYDAVGKLTAEYSTIVETSSSAKISYLTTDHLGSPRINTDAFGKVTARHDYDPFGEKVERASYGNDKIRQQFTGYERDGESSLDYAQARYYKPLNGRFTSIDPALESMKVAIPQSWNRYTYVLNNPLAYIDPSGELWIRNTADGNARDARYVWVDVCPENQTCYEVVAEAHAGNVVVYGSIGRADITTYRPNENGMIDLRSLSQHHDAQFIVADGQNKPEEFASNVASAAIFNVAHRYHRNHPGDNKLVVTASVEPTGKPAVGCRGPGRPCHSERHNGNSLDIRYMNRNGRDVRSVNEADVGRTNELIDLFKAEGLTEAFTGDQSKFNLGKTSPNSEELHGNHLHVGRPLSAPSINRRKL